MSHSAVVLLLLIKTSSFGTTKSGHFKRTDSYSVLQGEDGSFEARVPYSPF